MPLIKSKSPKAFEKNLKAEMHAGKPQDQALAIAYSVKRKAKKKMAEGGHLDTNAREHIKGKNFAGPDRSYPIEDAAHARNALARVSQHGSPELQEEVRAKVHKKYPGIDMKAEGGEVKTKAHPRYDIDRANDEYENHIIYDKAEGKYLENSPVFHTKEEAEHHIKTKLTKKLAEGGAISAKTEKRPMPEDLHDDAVMEAHNRAKKALIDDGWTGQPTTKQAQSNNGRMVKPIKHPRMVGSSVFQTKLRDEEDDLQTSEAPASDKEQPDADMNERDPRKQGKGPDMSKPHTTAKAYAEGGRINNEVSFHDSEEDEDPNESPIRESYMSPSEKEFMSKERMAPMLAEGGHIEEHEDNYADDGHHDSIAAAIMARRERLHAEIDSGAHDMDSAVRMAEGGEVDLSINADEEPNHEDQMSFEALKKENYSETPGLEELDQPHDSNLMGDEREDESENKEDRVSSIRSKMMAKRQFKSR